MPRCDRASTTAFWTAGAEPTVAASPMPLAPSGFSGVGVSVWEQANPGSGAALVELHGLVEGLGDPLSKAAMDLSLHEQWVQDAAAVVDGHVTHRSDATRLQVHL